MRKLILLLIAEYILIRMDRKIKTDIETTEKEESLN